MRFSDRSDAGRQLGAAVLATVDLADPVVLALPHGGVPVAAEVAGALDAQLDVLVARKIGAPGQPELGIGAIAEGGGVVVDRTAVRALRVEEAELQRLVELERSELERRVRRYRAGRPLPRLADREVVLVDDGLATGVTAEAALQALRRSLPVTLVLAAPVGTPETVRRLRSQVDHLVCPHQPTEFRAVGQHYEDFSQTTDDEVSELLELAKDPKRGRPTTPRPMGA